MGESNEWSGQFGLVWFSCLSRKLLRGCRISCGDLWQVCTQMYRVEQCTASKKETEKY
jgi:hypothetical protein